VPSTDFPRVLEAPARVPTRSAARARRRRDRCAISSGEWSSRRVLLREPALVRGRRDAMEPLLRRVLDEGGANPLLPVVCVG